MLLRKRDPDDGEKQQDAQRDMPEREAEPAAEDPDDVAEQRQAATRGGRSLHALAEGREHGRRQLEQLQAPGNAHDGAAQEKAAEEVGEKGKEAAEEQPQDVAQQVHGQCVVGGAHKLANSSIKKCRISTAFFATKGVIPVKGS